MHYIGVDLGGTNISVGLTDEEGKIISKTSAPTLSDREPAAIIKDIYNLCLKVKEDSGCEDIYSIGIGCPGTTDPEKAEVIFAPNLKNFRNIRLGDELKKYIDLPVFAENDANCAALGESLCGAAKGHKDSITITLGTGVGGGIIKGGEIFRGSFCGGTELGHTTIVVNGEECGCGRRGCWEAYASATALIRDTRTIAARYPNSRIFEMVGGDIRQIDAKSAFDAAEEGDPKMVEVIENYYKYLAVGIANLINIFEPEVFVIGGGVSAQGEKLIAPVLKHVEKMVYGGVLNTKINIAELGNDAGIIGAAMLGKKAKQKNSK